SRSGEGRLGVCLRLRRLQPGAAAKPVGAAGVSRGRSVSLAPGEPDATGRTKANRTLFLSVESLSWDKVQMTSKIFQQPARGQRRSALVFVVVVLVTTNGSHSATAGFSGTWSDACPCTIPCMCWKEKKASVPDCFNVQVFKIDRGSYRGVKIGGSSFVLVGTSGKPYSAPSATTLIIDKRLDKRRALAIEEFISRQFGQVKVLRLPLVVVEKPGIQKATVSGVLFYAVHLSKNDTVSADVANFLYPWLNEARKGVSGNVLYSTDSNRVSFSGTNALTEELGATLSFHYLRWRSIRGGNATTLTRGVVRISPSLFSAGHGGIWR